MAGLLGSVFFSYLLCSTKPTILLPPEWQQKQNKKLALENQLFLRLYTQEASGWSFMTPASHLLPSLSVFLSLSVCFQICGSGVVSDGSFPSSARHKLFQWLWFVTSFHVKIIWKSNIEGTCTIMSVVRSVSYRCYWHIFLVILCILVDYEYFYKRF